MSYAVTRRPKGGGAPVDPTSTFVIDESTAHLVGLASRLFTRALNNRIMPLGVTAGQWPLLLHLWEEDGLSQKELSRRVGIEEPTTTRTLARMERDGLVVRRQSTTDRRQMHVHLSDKGLELREELVPCAQDVNALATHGMSPQDKARINSLLSYMIARLA